MEEEIGCNCWKDLADEFLDHFLNPAEVSFGQELSLVKSHPSILKAFPRKLPRDKIYKKRLKETFAWKIESCDSLWISSIFAKENC